MAIKKEIKTRAPAITLEGRENQLIALAYDVAEKQMRSGDASSQVINHFLKLGSTRERLEQQKLGADIDLQSAKKGQIESAEKTEQVYKEAIEAMKRYGGHADDDEYLDD